jgi:hypothetical protein
MNISNISAKDKRLIPVNKPIKPFEKEEKTLDLRITIDLYSHFPYPNI